MGFRESQVRALLATAGLAVKKQNEKAFMAQVIQLARYCGWELVYHTHDSRRCAIGYPDLVLLKGNRQVVAELKVGNNKPTPEQQRWLDGYTRVGAEVFVWYPEHFPVIQKVLRGERYD